MICFNCKWKFDYVCCLFNVLCDDVCKCEVGEKDE